mmetsp:Transcript_95589/g.309681  ORF Transcript_95589/g.309681 Transcript_95589/m.309681 type:complete len:303 (-) Transcript_95589:104-1012(-)
MGRNAKLQARKQAAEAGEGNSRSGGVKKKLKAKALAPRPPPPADGVAAADAGGVTSVAAAAATGDDAAASVPPAGGLYVAGDVILLVGEGDLSFACALLRRLGASAYLIATVFDSEKALRQKYPAAAGNARRLLSAGMQVIYEVDCRELHERTEFIGAFTKIVFNFPHLGGDVEEAGVEEHRALLGAFLASAGRCLEPLPAAEVHITLKSGEPYASWRVEQLAKQASGAEGDASPLLRCDRQVPFEASKYRGYSHRRTRGDAYAQARGLGEENVVSGARTYVFRPSREALSGARGPPEEEAL